MGFGLFKPRSANYNNYIDYEQKLYIALETLKSVCERGKIEDKCYVITVTNPSYKSAYNLSYSLIRFYTKHLEEKTEYKFKRNFLLTKTRGLFSNQEKGTGGIAAIYLVPCELLNNLPKLYFDMFHLKKTFEEINDDLDDVKEEKEAKQKDEKEESKK